MDDSDSLINKEPVDFLTPEDGIGQSAVNFSAKAQKDNFLGGGSVKESEGLEARKAKIDGLWSDWDEIQKEPKLVSLFDRKSALDPNINPSELLYEHNYPERTKIADLQFENWTVNIDPKFVKDGYVYLMRGDHPGLDKKRILY